MGAMGAGEGVVDEDVAERCHPFREGGVVLFFLGVETGVFQQHHAAGLQLADCLLCHVADAVVRKGNRSEEHTSELQSLMRISYAVFCLKKKNKQTPNNNTKNT